MKDFVSDIELVNIEKYGLKTKNSVVDFLPIFLHNYFLSLRDCLFVGRTFHYI